MKSYIWYFAILLLCIQHAAADNTTDSPNPLEISLEPEIRLDFSTDIVSTVPADCSKFKEWETQQPFDPNAVLQKCCPIGEQFYSHQNGTRYCGGATKNLFKISTIFVKFYDGCIEDEEKNITLGIKIVDKREGSVIYNIHSNDMLYIIQNASLLSIDRSFLYFEVFNDYCMEWDDEEGAMTGFVWDFKELDIVVSRAEIVIMAVCMLASSIFLAATIFIYASIRELRDLHGKSLICHSCFLLSGYILLVAVNLFDIESKRIGYFIQFAILSCFFWMMVMCLDIFLHVWYYMPRSKRVTEETEKFHFAIYGAIAVIIPLLLVVCTVANRIPGMPSYYLKADSSKLESTHPSQAFFIPPICIVLLISIGLIAAIYFAFQKLEDKMAEVYIAKRSSQTTTAASDLLPKFEKNYIEKVHVMAKSTGILLAIMTICWCLELITYFSGAGAITLLDAFNSLQGVFIFFVFVCLPRPRKLIQKWWIDSGSIDLQEMEADTELVTMRNGKATA